MPIHHATVKRAARHGLTIAEENGMFVLVRTADGFRSDEYGSTAEALEEFERGETEFNDPADDEDEGKVSGSVVKETYHRLYSKNPNGPGCGDDLDCSLREAVMILFGNDKEPHVDLVRLRMIGEANGLWRGEWERLNPGMQRMNLSNRLRAFLRNHEDETIDLMGKVGRYGVDYTPAKGRKRKAAKAA